VKVALYLRVSTDKQEADNQAFQLRQFAASQGWDITAEFRDEAVSGAKGEKDRPAFRRMFEAASRRQFDVLLFWSLDRLSREGVLPTLTYLQRLTSYGIKWRSFTEQYIDSCGIFADAVISIMAVIAKQENVRRSERTRAGLERVRREGKALGRPRRLNGEHTAQIAQLRAQGLSLRAIGRSLNISLRSVQRLQSHSAVS
jgi:putative DNA-invertase from lambdoid prophage Rac